VRRVLFDENMPRKLRRDFPEFFIRTAQEQGWSSFRNGVLLREASASFDVLVTIDQRMRYQQNVRQLDIGIVVIEVPDTRLVYVRRLVPELRDAIERVKPGEVIVVTQT
jgi:predicted nuclease of predicted toxin-antitoxin system